MGRAWQVPPLALSSVPHSALASRRRGLRRTSDSRRSSTGPPTRHPSRSTRRRPSCSSCTSDNWAAAARSAWRSTRNGGPSRSPNDSKSSPRARQRRTDDRQGAHTQAWPPRATLPYRSKQTRVRTPILALRTCCASRLRSIEWRRGPPRHPAPCISFRAQAPPSLGSRRPRTRRVPTRPARINCAAGAHRCSSACLPQ